MLKRVRLKQVRVLVPWLIAAATAAAPAMAFWERSQWSRCSDAATPAEWSRHRCEDLAPYRDDIGRIGHSGVDGAPFPNERLPKGPARRGVVVRRLG